LFYHELWKQRLVSIGFRVLLIQKLEHHEVWDIRVCGNFTTQTYLLVTKPLSDKMIWTKDILVRQFQSEIRLIAQDLGLPIKRDCITVARKGAYLEASFIWPKGKPGLLIKKRKPTNAFSLLIRPWLRRSRN
jgi:hypothetical protein